MIKTECKHLHTVELRHNNKWEWWKCQDCGELEKKEKRSFRRKLTHYVEKVESTKKVIAGINKKGVVKLKEVPVIEYKLSNEYWKDRQVADLARVKEVKESLTKNELPKYLQDVPEKAARPYNAELQRVITEVINEMPEPEIIIRPWINDMWREEPVMVYDYGGEEIISERDEHGNFIGSL